MTIKEQLDLALYLLRNIIAATEQPPAAREAFVNYYVARAKFELGADRKLK